VIEIARKQKNYLPEPSFGTHFFLDLVEASIRYLPLYPDDPGVTFNEDFLSTQHNILPEVLPECTHLAEVIRVIDVSATSGGKLLQIYMNANLEEAIAFLSEPSGKIDLKGEKQGS
jgi:hypothetical protein